MPNDLVDPTSLPWGGADRCAIRKKAGALPARPKRNNSEHTAPIEPVQRVCKSNRYRSITT